MPPDERRADGSRTRPRPGRLEAVRMAGDADVAEIERLLRGAGRRARAERSTAARTRPNGAFQRRLRERLLASYATAAVAIRAAESVAMPAPIAAPRAWPAAGSAVRRLLGRGAAERWAVVALVAALVVAVAGSTASRIVSVPIEARATIAEAATIVRAGDSTALPAGIALHPGDDVRVGPAGRAVIAIDGGETRLAGGAEIRIDALSSTEVRMEVVVGRTYHRVALPAGGRYVVTTGGLSWSAVGTAFALDRDAAGPAGGPVIVVGLEHAVALRGDGLQATVDEGRAASVWVAPGGVSGLAIRPIEPGELADPWLVANAQRDRALGFGLGVPVDGAPATSVPTATGPGGASPSPAPLASEPPASPTPAPSNGPTPSGPEPTRRPSARSTDPPTPTPTPRPSHQPPALVPLALSAATCPGGVVLDWSPARAGRFDHYRTVRAASPEILRTVPPGPGAVAVDGSFTRNRWATSAHDTSLGAGATASYRTFALDDAGRVIAASPVRSASGRAIAELGPLSVGPGDGSTTALQWSPFEGPASCFSVEKLVYSTGDSTPSALEGAPSLAVSTNRSFAEAVAELPPGTYHFCVQVLRRTKLGAPPAFVVAQTAVATYTVP